MPPDKLPYCRHYVDDEDIAAVCEVLRSGWLTCGPAVAEFEASVAARAGTTHAVALSSGTAALHAAMAAINVGPGDEVIVPTLTFAATANCVLYMGARPVFADVEPDTLLLDPDDVAQRISPRTKAIIAVDYAGQPCRYDRLRRLADKHGLVLVADCAHSLGALFQGKPIGHWTDLAVFSFHPAKQITSGEGGMLVTNNPHWAERARRFRNHGIDADFSRRWQQRRWQYQMLELGFNYRLSDIHAALGTSQLRKLETFLRIRSQLASEYTNRLRTVPGICPLTARSDVRHAWHLYVVRVKREQYGLCRDELFVRLLQSGILVAVHYPLVHLHPFYRNTLGTKPGLCPVAESAAEEILSLPLFVGMGMRDIERVVSVLERSYQPCRKAA